MFINIITCGYCVHEFDDQNDIYRCYVHYFRTQNVIMTKIPSVDVIFTSLITKIFFADVMFTSLWLFAEDEGDELQIFIQDASAKWEVIEDITIAQSKNKDIATVEINKTPRRLMILRTRPDQAVDTLLKMVSVLENALTHRVVQLILRQKSEEPKEVVILGTSAQKSERLQKNITEEGFDAGPPPSQDLILREGQIMELRYRGNIQAEAELLGQLKMVYNSHIRTRVEFTVTEIDRFAQKGIDCYRGFTQVNNEP